MGADDNLLMVTPQDGSTLNGFSKGDKINFKTTFDAQCKLFEVKLSDQGANTELYSTLSFTYSETDGWSFTFYQDVAFQKGHTYTLKLIGHEEADVNSPVVGEEITVTYYGDGEEYGFSSVTYRVAPGDGEVFEDMNMNFCIITFYGGQAFIDENRSRIVDEYGDEHKFLQINDVNDAHSKYQFIIPISLMRASATHLTLKIYATDSNGLVIKGNKGVDENSYIEVNYLCTLGYPALDIYPTEGKVNILEKISFTCNGGLYVVDENAKILLYAADKSTILEEFTGEDLLSTGDFTMEAQLAEAIRIEGTYYLYIPEGFFKLGTREVLSKEQWITYQVVDRIEAYGVTLNPSVDEDLAELSTITITFDDWDVVYPFAYQLYNTPVKVINLDTGKDETNATVGYDSNRTKLNECYITLKKKIDLPGIYRVIIPERAFILGQNSEKISEAMYFDYTIKQGSGQGLNIEVTTTVAEDNALDRIDLSFKDYPYVTITNQNLVVNVYDTNGLEVASGTLKLAGRKTDLYVQMESERRIIDSGTYTLVIPSGYVNLGGTVYQRPMNIEFSLVTTGIASDVEHNEASPVIFDLQGRRVQRIDKKGVYIVNGRKVVKD